ncbi:GNAT family N-acetyltransferase [Massilia sp. METH4]|uniref:GNAT family N-acetyltransferase n=1 Tax=Massilia sp. METH4 TaxID=3123041 RepID=UPI0030CFB3A4
MKILETRRLLLRTMREDDAAFYLALVNDPEWLEHIGDKGIRTLDEARESIVAGPMRMQRLLGYSLYLVERKADGVPVGLCGLILRDTLPGTDIGYALAAPYRGAGYAYEAAAAVVDHARHRLGLRRLFGIVNPANAASIALLEKLGLSFLHGTRLPPEERETHVYCIDFAVPRD